MKTIVSNRKLLAMAVGAVTLAIGSQASAQDSGMLEEIVVTAQKREQSLLDIPFAISVIGEDEIKARGALDIKDLQYSVPGLSITNNLPGQDRVQIRGASSDIGLGLPTVGRYLDEVSVSSDATQRALDVPLLDIGRIEVLRGPQGTLYGAGSIGGTIRFISNSPEMNETSGSVGLGFNSVDGGSEGYEVNGVFNLPVVEDKFALRIAASTEDIAGWIDNTTTGESDINEAKRNFVRAKALFQPNDNFEASLMWMHYDFEQDNSNGERSVSGLDLFNVNDRQATGERAVDTPFPTPVSDEWDLVNLVLNFGTENANIVSSTGYLDRTIDFVAGNPNAFFPPGAFASFEVDDREAEVITQEIRVNSDWDKPLNYTVGVFYRKADTSEMSTLTLPFPIPPSITAGAGTSDSWAMFGEVSYEFSDNVTASFGLRHFEEDQEPGIFQIVNGVPVDVSPENQSFDALTPRFNLLWSVSDSASLYATISKGFRSGGINGAGSSIPTFKPEEAFLYEVGGRGEFLDGRVFVDGAIYYMDYDDIQIAITEGNFGRTTNVDSASGPGVDLAVSMQFTDSLSLDLTGGYVGREYDEVNLATPSNVAEGDSSQYTPKYTASASLAYDFDWSGNLGGMARLDLSHADGFSVYLRSLPSPPLQHVMETGALTYLSFRVGVIADRWQAVLSADNLLDEKDAVFPGGSFALDTYARPRTVSVKVDFNF